MTTAARTAATSLGARSEALAAAALAIVTGTALLFLVGFAAPQALHAAAHDTRHAFTFPCH